MTTFEKAKINAINVLLIRNFSNVFVYMFAKVVSKRLILGTVKLIIKIPCSQ